MEPFTFLFILSLAMLIGSYVAGSLPLTTKLSDGKIRLLNALGAGLLIGTSLMVVIPEGVETIYHSHSQTTSTTAIKRSPEEEEQGGEHTAIGLALIIGFALMFIIDQVSSLHMSAPSRPTEYAELDTVGGGSLEDGNSYSHQAPPSMTPTVGLVVHAAADGIALGASASHPQLSMVVFIAIMLHKAPASFALTSVLLASGLSHATIRKHLLIFAMAAPLGALVTYFLLSFFSATSPATLEYWTGVLLVFSGGTFLYVAMHALQEAAHHDHHGKKDKSTMAVILLGMVIPILLNMSHSH